MIGGKIQAVMYKLLDRIPRMAVDSFSKLTLHISIAIAKTERRRTMINSQSQRTKFEAIR